MTSDQIVKLRTRLRLSQSRMAQLLGVHEMTVLRWERDRLRPSYYQQCLLLCFRDAVRRDPYVGLTLKHLLAERAVVLAFYHLLRTAFEPLPL